MINPYSPIMWVGSKARAVRSLIHMVPADVTHMVSGSAGGCSFEMTMARAGRNQESSDETIILNYDPPEGSITSEGRLP